MEIIDLTLEYVDNMVCQSAFQSNIYVQLRSHEDTKQLGMGEAGDTFTSAWNYIGTIDHIGTHVDAYYHMKPDGLTIDKMPIEMFFGKAICYDMTHIPDRGRIEVKDLENAEEKTGVKVDGHIVLLYTGVSRYYPDTKMLFSNPELSVDGTHWLADRNSLLHGVDGASTDIMDLNTFPSHRVCRDRGISHYEWLANLDKLIGRGEFTFYGIPLRLKNGSASPVRAFGVFE